MVSGVGGPRNTGGPGRGKVSPGGFHQCPVWTMRQMLETVKPTVRDVTSWKFPLEIFFKHEYFTSQTRYRGFFLEFPDFPQMSYAFGSEVESGERSNLLLSRERFLEYVYAHKIGLLRQPGVSELKFGCRFESHVVHISPKRPIVDPYPIFKDSIPDDELNLPVLIIPVEFGGHLKSNKLLGAFIFIGKENSAFSFAFISEMWALAYCLGRELQLH